MSKANKNKKKPGKQIMRKKQKGMTREETEAKQKKKRARKKKRKKDCEQGKITTRKNKGKWGN